MLWIKPDRRILQTYCYTKVNTQLLYAVAGSFLHNGLLYMKINMPIGATSRKGIIHAVCLHTGDIHAFCNSLRVVPVNVECRINPRRWWEFWK